MNNAVPLYPGFSEHSRQAALACLTFIEQRARAQDTPRRFINWLMQQMADKDGMSDCAWLIRGDLAAMPDKSRGALQTAWPLWFSHGQAHYEKPVFYCINTERPEALRTLLTEVNRRAIFLNLADDGDSFLPKGVLPWFPIGVTAIQDCLPYDPANAQETRAIVSHALRSLYLDDRHKIAYIATHGERVVLPDLTACDGEMAWKGMYRIRRDNPPNDLHVRLCGAGKSLSRVLKAAAILEQHWGVSSDVWSCPSYTRLAQEAEAAQLASLADDADELSLSHLHRCMAGEDSPVIAVTDYHHLIATQLKPFIPGRFMAVGSDSLRRDGANAPRAEWIALCALKLLADDGKIATAQLESAMKQLRLMSD
ncbi:transketolase-like TK C-terminal-containing protein [Pantoea coffeiphila]|uniref:transketolase-like TK C-terminal-containing protein n=1 Tax=Pantoea coffeiphila TaxID=1465635 RepID=UPI0019620A5A|nr:pyruvate dehydrogenase (lipoamide) [Pantoea coffeiphila]MBM7341784.1 pyruvate dehydrogenase E1 component [Pantoea coffeiphila]